MWPLPVFLPWGKSVLFTCITSLICYLPSLNIAYKVYVIILSHHPIVRPGSVGTWHSAHPCSLPGSVSTFYFVSDSDHVNHVRRIQARDEAMLGHSRWCLIRKDLLSGHYWTLLTLTQGLYSLTFISCPCSNHLSQWHCIPQSPHGTHLREITSHSSHYITLTSPGEDKSDSINPCLPILPWTQEASACTDCPSQEPC